ncbi:MAG: TetR/AcrR family transcriptional regulator [Methylophilaceae bacterium]
MSEKRSRSRQVEEERLQEITLIAEGIIAKKGVGGLTLQEAISKSSISRGTFYKLIPSKETLITYLGIKGVNYWLELVRKSINNNALSRERLLVLSATHVLFNKLKPINYQCLFIANSESNKLLVNDELNDILDVRIHDLINYIDSCIRLGVSEGNFKIDANIDSIDLAFFLWAVRYGATVTASNYKISNSDLSQKYKLFASYNLDNMGWKPLSSELNYDRVLTEIFNEFYGKEMKMAKKLDAPNNPFSITEHPFA